MNHPTIMGQFAATMGANMAKQFDDRLRACIEKRTGPLADLNVLRGRLEAVKIQGSDKITYYLDGKAIAQVGEIQAKVRDGFMHAEQVFKELP